MGCCSRPLRSAPIFLAAALTAVAMSAARAAPPLELAVKATFLVKFAPFVEWPASVFAAPDSPVTLCAMADDPVVPLLEQVANGQKDGNRALVVQRIGPNGTAQGCNIFYFEPDSQPGAAIAAGARNAPLLTVTSANDGGAPPAMVTFIVDRGRVHFDIDNAQAIHAGLQISSNLLALARNVKRAP